MSDDNSDRDFWLMLLIVSILAAVVCGCTPARSKARYPSDCAWLVEDYRPPVERGRSNFMSELEEEWRRYHVWQARGCPDGPVY